MKRRISWALWLPFLLVALRRSWSQQQDAGLFPPVEFRSSFSSFRSVSATSICEPCMEAGCTTCNSTCLHGQDSPQPVNVLEEGERSSGVVRTPGQLIKLPYANIVFGHRLRLVYPGYHRPMPILRVTYL